MITALLLAAGEGRRMNHQAKALLAFADQTFIERSLRQLEGAVDDIIVVTGAYRDAVRPYIQSPFRRRITPLIKRVCSVPYNVGCGCRPETEAVLITLVDLPFIRSTDYQAALERWQPGKILRSMSQGEPAHPVIIDKAFFSDILDQPPSDRGCSFLFQKYPNGVLIHECPQGRIDIDCIEDYHAHITC